MSSMLIGQRMNVLYTRHVLLQTMVMSTDSSRQTVTML